MSERTFVPLRDLLTPADEAVPVREDRSYPNVGIYSFGRGLFGKAPIQGVTTSAKSLFCIRSGNFIYSQLFAFEGAYGLISDAFDKHFVSNEYPSFTINTARLLPGYLDAYFRRPSVWHAIGMGSKGVGSRRIRVHPERVLSHAMPLPPLAEQEVIVARLNALADKTRQVAVHLDAIEADADQLLAQRFEKAIVGAPCLPMAEVAPLVRRAIVIDSEARYPELGVRSFGKGTFHKPAITGMDVGTKRLFRIEAGDLIFSNVFAWEGAIAIAKSEDEGRFGSHRFMTCVVDERLAFTDFVRYYLLSSPGLEKVQGASPGGAGRNRTLGVEKLARIEVPTPSLPVQRAFVALQSIVTALKARQAAIREANAALLPASLERMFAT